MIENKYKITTSELDTVLLSSPASLPDSPHERGMGARTIKKSFSEPLRLLTGYINTKLEALRSEMMGAPGSFSAILGENISGLFLWLDGLYPSSSGSGLVNLVNPKEAYAIGTPDENGASTIIENGFEIPLNVKDGDFSVSMSYGIKTVPACILTIHESNLLYVSLYRISDTVCRILYKHPQLPSLQSYEFSVSAGELNHITAVKTGDSITFYSQGNLVCAVSIPFLEPSAIRIGKDTSDTASEISLRSLRLFKKSLSPSEVTGEYSAFRQREENYLKKISHVLNLSLNLSSPIREIFERAVKDIRVQMDENSFTVSIMPISLDGKELLDSPYKIDLPLEEMIVSGEYVDTAENPASIMLTLRSGSNVFIPVGELVKGLINLEDFSNLENKVSENEGKISQIGKSAFFGAAFDREKKELNFYSESNSLPVSNVSLDFLVSEPYALMKSQALCCKAVPDAPHSIRVSHKRRNNISGASDLNIVNGEISATSNIIYYGNWGNASYNILCDDMEDKEVYTLSFSANDYHDDFSICVYETNPVTVVKGGRTSVSFLYNKSRFGGAIPVRDGVRTSNSVELYDFTLVKGAASEYIPICSKTEKITVQSCGKNLLNPLIIATVPVEGGRTTYSDGCLTITANAANCYTASFHSSLKIPVNPGEDITFSWEASAGNATGSVYIFGNGSSKSMVFAPTAEGKVTYTVPDGISYITYRVGVSGAGNSITYSKMQIERSSAPTDYEPYTQGDSVSLALNEVGFLTPLSPYMNVFTLNASALLCGEFLKSGAMAGAVDLILSDPSHRANTHVTSAAAEYNEAENKLVLKLFNGSNHISSVDMTAAVRALISKEASGGA